MFSHDPPKTACKPYGTREEIQASTNVACKNIAIARSLATLHGFTIEAENLGGVSHRQVIFDIWSGHVWVRHAKVAEKAA